MLTPAAVPVPAAAQNPLSGAQGPLSGAAAVVRGSGTKAALGPALVADPGLKPRIAYAPARVAVTGRRVSPPLSESIELPGQNRTMRRLAQAVTTASARD